MDQSNILNGKAIVYFTCSIIPLLAFSIFFADLICTILSIVFIFFIIKNYNSYYKNTFFIISLVFYLICLLSSALSKDFLFSIQSSLPLIRIIVFIFLLSYLIKYNKFFFQIFYNFIKYTFLILVTYGLLQYINDYNYLISNKIDDFSYVRLTLPFSDEQKLGSYLVRLLGLMIATYILKKSYKKSENFILFFLTLLTCIVILLSGERTSLFFLLLFLTTTFIFLQINRKLKITFLFSVVTIFFIIFFQNTNIANRIIFDKNNKLNFSSNKDEIIIFTSQHTAHYLSGFEMFLEKPILGQGPKMFRVLCDDKKFNFKINGKKSCSSHPHNTYIQLLAETGLLCTLLFSFGFLHIFYFFSKILISKFTSKKINYSNSQIIIISAALIVFWPFSPNGNFFNNWILIINSIPLSFYVNEFFNKKTQ